MPGVAPLELGVRISVATLHASGVATRAISE
jgi:hypothetical protein